MKELVECFIAWLQAEPATNNAWKILEALARETLKRVDSPDPEQREFDVLDIAAVCRSGPSLDYDNAKRWFSVANPSKYLAARRKSLESFFRDKGHTQCLKLDKLPSKGRHKTTWYLRPYEFQEASELDVAGNASLEAFPPEANLNLTQIVYSVTQPGEIELSWLGRLLLGTGTFKTRSWRGGLWASGLVFSALAVFLCAFLILQMRSIARGVQTGDLVIFAGLISFALIIWKMQLRPLILLLEDRIGLASESLLKLKEEKAHFDLAKDGGHRYMRLVRYSAVCPICAGDIELRYGHGANYRRLFGCCTEVPTEHVFTFDRVTKTGYRYLI